MNKDELKEFRERVGLTQGELSKQLSVANNTVSRWELGQRSIPEFLPLALETIERRLFDSTAGSKAVSTVGSIDNKSVSTVGSKVKSTVGSSDLSATDNEFNMTAKDVGKVLDLHPRTVREYAAKGLLKGKQDEITKHWSFRSQDVDEFQATRGKV
jgi:DNA-binding XRE family transcriptional regulator